MTDLNSMSRELQSREYRRQVAATDQVLTKELLPQKPFPEVLGWLDQFRFIKPRYKFLVLTGTSGMGKTMFARTLPAPGMQALELNCATESEPDLRAYRLTQHDVIIFDECKASVILRQKKLFQCSNSLIELGCSTTNCHAYTVLVFKKKFVIASNTWDEDLRNLDPCDSRWLRDNSVVLYVEAPMWQQEEPPSSSPEPTNPWDILPLPWTSN